MQKPKREKILLLIGFQLGPFHKNGEKYINIEDLLFNIIAILDIFFAGKNKMFG